jgi:hypothetical protein
VKLFWKLIALMSLALPFAALPAATPDEYRLDAFGIVTLLEDNYAYPERLAGGRFALTPKLETERDAVHDDASLLAFAERALLLLEDHHAITGSSFPDSWGIVPSFADLWIERQDGTYRITAVRENSPAEKAGIKAGSKVTAINKVETAQAVAAFWADLGRVAPIDDRAASFAARILAAGRRDRFRALTIHQSGHAPHDFPLPSLYTLPFPKDPVSAVMKDGALTIRINDSLGMDATITAFDLAMTGLAAGTPVLIDISNTPSGGTSSVARAIMGWFVTQPRFYQIHNSPGEERRTGIARQWIEQVLPRSGGKYHAAPVSVRVSRWTGSMGEGIAIGMHALGYPVSGGPMGQLLGAIEDFRLPHSGQIIKFPTEKLFGVDGTPREDFVAPLEAQR